MAVQYEMQDGTTVATPTESDAQDMGLMLQTAQDKARDYATGIMTLVADSNADALLAYLDTIRKTVKTHSGNASRKIAYTLAIIAHIEEIVDECGSVITPRYHDLLLGQLVLLARQIPASVQAKDSESGKNVRNDAQSHALRGYRSVATAMGRVAPLYIPAHASDARTTLENVLKLEADREAKRLAAQAKKDATPQIAASASDASDTPAQ